MSILGFKTKDIAEFKDPFLKKNVDSISIRIGRHWMTEKWRYKATVYFVNGQTNGSQDFDEASYKALMAKLDTFLNSL